METREESSSDGSQDERSISNDLSKSATQMIQGATLMFDESSPLEGEDILQSEFIWTIGNYSSIRS